MHEEYFLNPYWGFPQQEETKLNEKGKLSINKNSGNFALRLL